MGEGKGLKSTCLGDLTPLSRKWLLRSSHGKLFFRLHHTRSLGLICFLLFEWPVPATLRQPQVETGMKWFHRAFLLLGAEGHFCIPHPRHHLAPCLSFHCLLLLQDYDNKPLQDSVLIWHSTPTVEGGTEIISPIYRWENSFKGVKGLSKVIGKLLAEWCKNLGVLIR